MRHRRHASVRDWVRYWILELANLLANYPKDSLAPAVTIPLLARGQVGVALSCLYVPLDEFDVRHFDGDPPEREYFHDLIAQLDDVEGEVRAHKGAEVARTAADMDRIAGQGRVAIVHCVEGGFLLGNSPDQVHHSVAKLADKGIAYVTLAHLFYRSMATNVAAIPFLKDWLYHKLFPQPKAGLTELGWAVVRACVEHGVLLDITHLSQRSLDELFSWLDDIDPGRSIAVFCSHGAARLVGKSEPEYNLTDDTIRRIAQRGGVIGLLLCSHYLTAARKKHAPRGFEESVELLCKHARHIREVAGTWDCVAIGTDLDGFIQPALKGLEDSGDLARLPDALASRLGEEVARAICSENSLKLLRAHWGRKMSLSKPVELKPQEAITA